MSVMKKILKTVFSVLLGGAGLYFGICSVSTLLKAMNQPHLETVGAAAQRIDFCGFYILSATLGVTAILSIVLCLVLCFSGKKKPVKGEKA